MIGEPTDYNPYFYLIPKQKFTTSTLVELLLAKLRPWIESLHKNEGTRKAKATDIQSFNTRLFYDLIWQKIISATSIFADLVSNYDFVVHSIVDLSLQRVEVPKDPILCTFTMLQNMSHSARMAFREPKYTYGGDIWAVPLNLPLQGLGQVNGAAPAIWAIIITTLLNWLKK